MDLTNPQTIERLLRKYRISPRRSAGQNFLIERRALDQVVAAANLTTRDVVLEVGPGFGVLTVELARRVGRVVTVELDHRLVKALRDVLQQKNITNVQVIEGDILKLLATRHVPLATSYKVVSNLPYQITGHFLKRILETAPRPELLVLTLQQEVAERITAKPGDMSIIAVAVQFYGEPDIIARVPRTSFLPPPEVDSAIVRIRTKSIAATPEEQKAFFRIVRIGFSSRRKTLANNLAAGLKVPRQEMEKLLITQNLEPKVRAQELSVNDWLKLIDVVHG